MKKISLIVIALFVAPFLVTATNYYVSDYDPDYVPYNLQEVIDSMDYDSCIDDLRDFDDNYEQYLGIYGTPVSVGDTLDVEFGALKELYEEEFRQCLISVRSEMQEESIDKCDFEVIESLNKEEERSFRSGIRTCENLRALDSCDFEYIEDMEGMEKFNYRVEIDECEATLESVVEEEPQVEITEPVESLEQEVVVEPVSVPTPISEPVYVAPTPAPVTPEPDVEPLPQTEVEELSEPKASSSDAETFTMTQEEIDALVAQKLAEAEEKVPEQGSVEKPGFFKRVWNFFTSWF